MNASDGNKALVMDKIKKKQGVVLRKKFFPKVEKIYASCMDWQQDMVSERE